MPASGGLTFSGALARIAAAIALVLATFNPTPWSYVRWAFDDVSSFGPEKLLVGLLLVGAWVLYVRAALLSIGFVGAALIAGVIAALVWLAVDHGLLDPGNTSALIWIALFSLGLILGIGLSWSHLRRRLTGQVDIEDDGAP
ncbi:MAG TPA: DUF6524 family protein [Myxococcota bacterium]|nr:DUF6524 family protein [Myxococcota bacterium]